MFRKLADVIFYSLGAIAVFIAFLRNLLGPAPPDPEPPPPPLPPLPPLSPPESPERRRFFNKLSIGIGSLAAIAVAIPTAWYLLDPLFRYVPDVWRPVGKADSFPEGQTVKVTFRHAADLAWSGGSGTSAAWLRHEEGGGFVAFAVYCSHLGCPVRWESSAQMFMCPCHGGVYYSDGTVAAGPPPTPLAQYPVRVRNGEVEIRTTRIPIAGVN